MRITGGTLRGRHLKIPASGDVRPTQDAVREALGSMLADRWSGCVFLDLFGGTGSVGIEAWSRGASKVVWVEGTRSVARILEQNVQTLCGAESIPGERKVIVEDVLRWLKRPAPVAADIAFADPPYGGREKDDMLAEVMPLVATGRFLKPGGIFVAEQRASASELSIPGYAPLTTRRYGQTRLSLFQFEKLPL